MSHYYGMTTQARYSIGELADLAGISRRAVRFYVQRGLLQSPEGVGRGDHYTTAHIERLQQIKLLQEAGHSLDEIALLLKAGVRTREDISHPCPALDSPFPATDLPVIDTGLWLRLKIADGCELHLERGKARPTQAVLRRLQQAINDILGTPSGGSPDSGAWSPVKSREEPSDE